MSILKEIADASILVAENQRKVHEAGKSAGRDEFQSDYQNNGKRKDYDSAYAGVGWTNDNFNPKHSMKPTTAYMMFRNAAISGDLVEILADKKVELDFSNSTQMLFTFNNMFGITRVGIVDLSKCNSSSANYIFQNSKKLVTIDGIKLPSTTLSLTDGFTGCTALANISFIGEGKLRANMNFKDSPLSHDSIVNVYNALYESASGKSVTFSKAAVNAAFGIDVDDATTYPEGSEYYNLRHSKSNWTVNYI